MLSMTACGAERSPSDTSKNEVQTQSSDKKDKNKSEEKEKDDKDKKTSEEKEDKDDKDDNDAEESSKRSEDSAYDAIYGLLSSEWSAHGDNTTTISAVQRRHSVCPAQRRRSLPGIYNYI